MVLAFGRRGDHWDTARRIFESLARLRRLLRLPPAGAAPGGSASPPVLSLQFCAELNQPVLPNIRKWKGPRGAWKAVVADSPSTPLQKVPSPARLAFSFLVIEASVSPNHGHLEISLCQHPSRSFASLPLVTIHFQMSWFSVRVWIGNGLLPTRKYGFGALGGERS